MAEAPNSCENGCFACFVRYVKPQQAGGDVLYLHAAGYKPPPPPIEAKELLPAAAYRSGISPFNANHFLNAVAYGPPPPVEANQPLHADAYIPPPPAEVRQLLSAATHQVPEAASEESKTSVKAGALSSPSNQNSVDTIHVSSSRVQESQWAERDSQNPASFEKAIFQSPKETPKQKSLVLTKHGSSKTRPMSNVLTSTAYADLDEDTRAFVIRGMTEEQISYIYPANGVCSRLSPLAYETAGIQVVEPTTSCGRDHHHVDETESNSAEASPQIDPVLPSPLQPKESETSPLKANQDEADDVNTFADHTTKGDLGDSSRSPEKPLPSLPDDESSDSDGPPTPRPPPRFHARFYDRLHDRFPDQFPDMREYLPPGAEPVLNPEIGRSYYEANLRESRSPSPIYHGSVLGGRWLLQAEEQERKAAEVKNSYAKAAVAYKEYNEKETALSNFKNLVDDFNEKAAAINASNKKAASDLVTAKDKAAVAIEDFKEKADVYNGLYAKRYTAFNTAANATYRNDQARPALKIRTSDFQDDFMNTEPQTPVKAKRSSEKSSISPIKSLIKRSRSLRNDAFGKRQNASKSLNVESAGGFGNDYSEESSIEADDSRNHSETETPKPPKSPIKRFARLLGPKSTKEPLRLNEVDQYTLSIVPDKPARLLGLKNAEESMQPTHFVAQSPGISTVEEEPEDLPTPKPTDPFIVEEESEDLPTPKPTDPSTAYDIPEYQKVLAADREENPAPSIKSLLTCSSFESSFLRQFDENGYDGQFDLPVPTVTSHRRDLLEPIKARLAGTKSNPIKPTAASSTTPPVTWGEPTHPSGLITHSHPPPPSSTTVPLAPSLAPTLDALSTTAESLASGPSFLPIEHIRRNAAHRECAAARLQGMAVGRYRYHHGQMKRRGMKWYALGGMCLCWEGCACVGMEGSGCGVWADGRCPCLGEGWVSVTEGRKGEEVEGEE